MTPEDPEEPHLHSEPSLLSPASPKPIHFPAPTDIPVLNNMMDVSFNQTELHMQDPSMRNTEIRDGAWRSPTEENEEEEAGGMQSRDTQVVDHSTLLEPLTSIADTAMLPGTTSDAQQDVKPLEDANLVITDAPADDYALPPTAADVVSDEHSLHEHVPTGMNTLPHVDTALVEQQQSAATTPVPSNVDVQSLLSFLQTAPKAVTPNTSTTPTVPGGGDQASSFLASLGVPPLVTIAPAAETQPAAASQPNVPFGLINQPPTDLAAALANVKPTDAAPLPRALSSVREQKLAAGEPITEDDVPWTSDIQMKYDEFIQEERKHVNAGAWDSFPLGSRLFIGNLSSDSVTKRDIFHVFHVYGPLAQISIKQAYGFVQFLNADDCGRALSTEQGRSVKDKRIHLEISKPQKSRNQQNNNNTRNRSRSPDRRKANHDRGQGSGASHRYRSPSPRGGHRDRYDDRGRRSKSPVGYGRTRHGRSPSLGDDLPLPMRPSHEVPDVQIIAKEGLDRDFIAWCEKTFLGRGLKVAVLILGPHLHEDAVIRRQIVEGVLAVSRLDRQAQSTGKISLRIFNRGRGTTQDVSFDDYDNLDPAICVELVLRAKSAQAPPPQAQYGYLPPQAAAAPYGYSAPSAPPSYMPPVPQTYPLQSQYGLQQPPGQPPLDIGSLQHLLATARSGGTHQVPTPQATPIGFPGYPPQQVVYQAPGPPQPSYVGYQAPPTAYGVGPPLPHGMPPAAPPPSGTGQKIAMQDVLARLGNYQK